MTVSASEITHSRAIGGNGDGGGTDGLGVGGRVSNLARGPEKAPWTRVKSKLDPGNHGFSPGAHRIGYLGGALTRQSGISYPYQSGPRMKGAKSDWRVNDLHVLE